jgi:hypothetical protein
MNNGTEIVAKQAGAVSKRTPEMLAKLEELIGDGLTQEQACSAAGISRPTLVRWRKADPDFEDRLTAARDKARRDALSMIKAAGRTDWRAAESWLRLSYWSEYARDHKTSVNINTGMQIIVDEETRKRIQDLRDEILLPQKAKAIEAEVEPLGLPAPKAQAFTPAEPDSPEGLALLEKKEKEQAAWDNAEQPEPECYIEPPGQDHPAVRHLGLGPK